jgi:hypothetical protein
VVPATYRLLINDMRDEESAYLFMREDGSRLRQYGRAKQFDHWFLRKAQKRGDLSAIADRLAAIYNSPTDDPALYSDSMFSLLESIETFKYGSEDLSEAMTKLAAAAKAPKELKARWNWIKEVVRFSPEAGDYRNARKDPPAEPSSWCNPTRARSWWRADGRSSTTAIRRLPCVMYTHTGT